MSSILQKWRSSKRGFEEPPRAKPLVIIRSACRKGFEGGKSYVKKIRRALTEPRWKRIERKMAVRIAKREVRNAVKPLPEKRPRALTLRVNSVDPEGDAVIGVDPVVLSGDKGKKKRGLGVRGARGDQQRIVDQLGTCHLWKLPYELRARVWQYAVGCHHIHIVRRVGRLGNVYCPAQDPTDPIRRDLCLESRDESGFYRPTAWPKDIRPLSLLLSCRQIYSESIDFLYSLNTFAFDEPVLLTTFLTNLLPHRRHLITSCHISPNFENDHWLYWRPHRQFYGPRKYQIDAWEAHVATLAALPNLHSLFVTPILNKPKTFTQGGQGLRDAVKEFVNALNTLQLSGPFILGWHEEWSYRRHSSLGPWELDSILPENANFSIRRMPRHTDLEHRTFLVPIHVQCLHCASYTIIRKTAKGNAEGCTVEIEADDFFPAQAQERSRVIRYWTMHACCGGWIEFEYNFQTKEWSVEQGARQIDDEEAARHLSVHGNRYPAMESAHERIQGLESLPWPNLSTRYNPRCDMWTRAIDSPVRQAFYRNVGWTWDGSSGGIV